ncbi:hypothetical protein GWI33_011426 [Rhynchophorus ferrugineus]|uniref:Uncharacterized protein n=1 Tax=Rhynchophorus ferrugineus TaxID=354439 RepID=A0A834J1N6_RHYFE|nr:hypothetical protein GWI33_011426 [Rhynchophorus ferrugineus]
MTEENAALRVGIRLEDVSPTSLHHLLASSTSSRAFDVCPGAFKAPKSNLPNTVLYLYDLLAYLILDGGGGRGRASGALQTRIP